MARAKKGTENFRGKLGNTVTYDLNGQIVKRTIGVNTKPATNAQLMGRQKVSLITELLRPVKEFLRTGFALATKGSLQSPYNLATSINMLHAIKGTYPNQEIDYSKVIFSYGSMPVTPDVQVKATDAGLEFSWDKDYLEKGMKWNDSILMMAYIPEKRDAYFQLNGSRRNIGTDFLGLPKLNKKVHLEVYSSFISANRESISNSRYLGNILW